MKAEEGGDAEGVPLLETVLLALRLTAAFVIRPLMERYSDFSASSDGFQCFL